MSGEDKLKSYQKQICTAGKVAVCWQTKLLQTMNKKEGQPLGEVVINWLSWSQTLKFRNQPEM